MAVEKTMDKIVSLAKVRGFVYPGSDIYGGLANSWDYGPLGVQLKNNVKAAWWKKFVQESPYNVGLDAAIIMNPKTWVASGHVGGFSDPLIDCKQCKARQRADNLVEDWNKENGVEGVSVEGMSPEDMVAYIREKNIPCPVCGGHNFTDIRKFNLMFKTFIGVTEDATSEVYLRPETAQGIFVNFANVQRSARKKLPFGICQIGKSFRNEITPGNFIFRTREFEQMELEFFCEPGTDLEWFDYWKTFCHDWLINLGIKDSELRTRDHAKEELEGGDVRTVLRFHPFLAPIKIGVLPLSAKLTDKAQPIFEKLSKKYMCELDDRQSIGKRYRRQDEIGTPYCVVYDFDSENDGCVTIRERDSMKNVEYEPGNIRFPIDKLEEFFSDKFDF